MKSDNLTEAQKAVLEAADNPYTESIDEKMSRISYTADFNREMVRLLNEGKSPIEAYEACGYNVEKLGRNRAFKAASNAKAYVKKHPVNDWRNYAVTSLDEIDTESEMTVREAQLYSMVKILQVQLEVEKKTNRQLEILNTPLKKEWRPLSTDFKKRKN